MLFNSYQFLLIFLPCTLGVYFALGRIRQGWATAWLALASIFFYGYWSAKYVPLLLGSVAFNFLCGRILLQRSGTAHGRALLAGSIAANLLLLGFYKYADFFLGAINDAANARLPLLGIALPLGISFFTFTQIAFLVDAYRGLIRGYSFMHYLLFASYFPHLIAGPIIHHSQIVPQFRRAAVYEPAPRPMGIGLTIIAIGLAKKVLVADHFAPTVGAIFDAAHAGVPIHLGAAWCAVTAYSFQIYFDFSGYSDMAVGISKLFGVDLPMNFNSPYKSSSIIDFWRRWHMTLSTFLREYLYFPLGGNRRGRLRQFTNLMTTMILGGLWHGANYTFVVWGALHGVYLAINHAWRSTGILGRAMKLPGKAVGTAITFSSVLVGWAFFRASDLSSAMNILRGMAGMNGIALQEGMLQHLAALNRFQLGSLFVGAAILVWTMPNTRQIAERLDQELSRAQTPLRYQRVMPAICGAILGLALLEMQKVSEFLYFNF